MNEAQSEPLRSSVGWLSARPIRGQVWLAIISCYCRSWLVVCCCTTKHVVPSFWLRACSVKARARLFPPPPPTGGRPCFEHSHPRLSCADHYQPRETGYWQSVSSQSVPSNRFPKPIPKNRFPVTGSRNRFPRTGYWQSVSRTGYWESVSGPGY